MRIHFSKGFVLLCFVFAAFGCKSKETLHGKVFNTISRDNIKSADPTNAYDDITLDVLQQIYETPYQYNYFADKLEIIPNLADGMAEVSKDKLTFTLHIKKGIRFQDDPCFKATNGKGREVKAQDFIYGWKRHADPKNESQGFWIWDGRVVGMNEFAKKFGQGRPAKDVMNDDIEGMKALDDYTVQLKLTKPYPQLAYVMTMPFTSPIPHEAIEYYGKDFANHPLGTGPFRAIKWEPTSEILLTRNENFHDEFVPPAEKMGPMRRAQMAAYAGKKLPIIDGIDFQIIKEEQPRWLAFLKGRFDETKIPKDNFSDAIVNTTQVRPELAQKGITVSIEHALQWRWMSMNTEDPVLKNKYLRQALASAVDRKALLDTFMNGRGYIEEEALADPLPDHCGSKYRWTYDLERAKELLAKAGYPNGQGLPTLHWDTRNTEITDRQIAELVARSFAKIGVKMEIIPNTFPAYLEKMKKKNLQLSKGGWIMDYPDAENALGLLYGPNESPGPNESNYHNAEYDKLFEKVAAMESGPERKKLVCEMEKIVEEDAPWGFFYFESEYRLVNKWLKNYRAVELIINKYKYLDVDVAERDAALKQN